jgi:hypothetical protein
LHFFSSSRRKKISFFSVFFISARRNFCVKDPNRKEAVQQMELFLLADDRLFSLLNFVSNSLRFATKPY